MVITDPSGEIHNATKETLIQKFFEVKVINPNDLKNTFFYNPLERAKTITDIKKITDILINFAYKGESHSKKDEFWNTGAKTILNLILSAVKNNPDKSKRNLEEARSLILLYGQQDPKLKFDKLAVEIEKNIRGDENLINELNSFFATEPKVRDNFITTAKNALEIFSDPNICKLTKIDTIKFENLIEGGRPGAIFLIVPEHEINYYSCLLNLFYTQVFNYCSINGLKNTQPVYFLLDEFGNMGQLPNFKNIITTLRKRNCSISIILQSIKQLHDLYGRDNAETIFDSCASKIFFGGLGHKTCFLVERLLGKQTLEQKNNDTGKKSLHGRALMTADEIRRMDRSKIIYIFSNKDPFLLPTTYFQK